MLYAYSQTPIQEISSYDKQNFDASAGLLVNYKKLYVGVSFFHINQPDDGLTGSYKLPVKYSFNASYNFVAAKYLLINFQTLYQYQASFNRMQVGLDALFFKHIIVGAGLSVDDKQYLSLGYRHNYFSVGFSYNETPVYKVRAYEICASFNLRTKENRKAIGNFESW
ncbi:MAG: type IX secretion system membrane protein PorP/SprF [Bacteroidia bacterium]|nr:type IX secretion system membrane protein PorP/SprF [Bacteroidia bacterium]